MGPRLSLPSRTSEPGGEAECTAVPDAPSKTEAESEELSKAKPSHLPTAGSGGAIRMAATFIAKTHWLPDGAKSAKKLPDDTAATSTEKLHRKPTDFQATLERLRANDESLTELDWRGKGLGAQDAVALADAIKVNSTLTTINLRWNNIGAKGAAALAEAIKVNTALTTLDLYNNYIGNYGAAALAVAIKVNSAVTTLDLGYNKIGAKGAAALAVAIKVNSALTTLYLEGNDIGDEGAAALADAIKVNSALTTLNLRYNNIGAKGAAALADAIKVNSTLTTLNLRWNNIGAEGAAALADAIKVNTTITSLDVRGNDIRAEQRATVEGLVQRNRVILDHERAVKEHGTKFYLDFMDAPGGGGRALGASQGGGIVVSWSVGHWSGGGIDINGNYVARQWQPFQGNDETASSSTETICPVWEAAAVDGSAYRLLCEVLESLDSEYMPTLKNLVDESKNKDGSTLLHVVEKLDSQGALDLCKFLNKLGGAGGVDFINNDSVFVRVDDSDAIAQLEEQVLYAADSPTDGEQEDRREIIVFGNGISGNENCTWAEYVNDCKGEVQKHMKTWVASSPLFCSESIEFTVSESTQGIMEKLVVSMKCHIDPEKNFEEEARKIYHLFVSFLQKECNFGVEDVRMCYAWAGSLKILLECKSDTITGKRFRNLVKMAKRLPIQIDETEEIYITGISVPLKVEGPFSQIIEAWRNSVSTEQQDVSTGQQDEVLQLELREVTLLIPTGRNKGSEITVPGYSPQVNSFGNRNGPSWPSIIQLSSSVLQPETFLVLKHETKVIQELSTKDYEVANSECSPYVVMTLKGIQIYVNFLNGQNFVVDKAVKAKDIKLAIEKNHDVATYLQVLVYRDEHILEDDKFLVQDYGMSDGDEVALNVCSNENGEVYRCALTNAEVDVTPCSRSVKDVSNADPKEGMALPPWEMKRVDLNRDNHKCQWKNCGPFCSLYLTPKYFPSENKTSTQPRLEVNARFEFGVGSEMKDERNVQRGYFVETAEVGFYLPRGKFETKSGGNLKSPEVSVLREVGGEGKAGLDKGKPTAMGAVSSKISRGEKGEPQHWWIDDNVEGGSWRFERGLCTAPKNKVEEYDPASMSVLRAESVSKFQSFPDLRASWFLEKESFVNSDNVLQSLLVEVEVGVLLREVKARKFIKRLRGSMAVDTSWHKHELAGTMDLVKVPGPQTGHGIWRALRAGFSQAKIHRGPNRGVKGQN